jgi:hypothetical protein
MARRAVDVEALLPADQIVARDGKRKSVYIGVAEFPGIASRINPKMAARDGPFHLRPLGSMIGKEIALSQWLVAWLIVHVLTASGSSEGKHERNAGEVIIFQLQPPLQD